ncbi:hypothetical protein SEVIR_9G485200v4 [Setaria viridis]|uniref:Uncharacterized protein n=1 Tax=Setaria viridis TaxID=4556 RepID=A0A4V6Y7U5_SETVI|nr:hypothetical protein SEVIR_9G485200v2 [Setaria viridis]
MYHQSAAGDGQSTDFWEDIWEGGVPMSNAFPALHSHVVKTGTTVEETVEQGILPFLAPRLSSQATRELQALEELLADLILTSEEDARTSCFESVNHGLHTGHQFRTTLSVICSSSSGRVIPLPVSKFFGWLMVQDKLQCKKNLLRKHIVDSAVCEPFFFEKEQERC